MEDMKIMTTEQLKNELNAMKNKILIMRIITHGLVILGLVAVPFNFFISLLCWIIAPAFGIPLGRIIKKRNKISNQLADNVIGCVLRDVFGDDVEYDLSGEFKPDKEAAPLYFQVPKGRVWETKGRYNIKAAYNGVNIELGNYYINEILMRWKKTINGMSRPPAVHYLTVHGLYAIVAESRNALYLCQRRATIFPTSKES